MTGTAEARAEILARVRAATEGARGAAREVPRDYAHSRHATEGLVELFVERVADYRAVVERVDAGELPAAVAAACAAYGLRRLAVPADVPGSWVTGLAGLPGVELLRDEAERGTGAALTAGQLDAVDGVLTGAAVGVAQTGTLVLDSGPAQGRRALSLVPDVHLCVVGEEQVVDDVPVVLRRLTPTRPLTWISGPSATSDIELDRVEGVHGPRTLHVLVVSGGPGTGQPVSGQPTGEAAT